MAPSSQESEPPRKPGRFNCQVCDACLTLRLTHAVHCRKCGRYFSDPAYAPAVAFAKPDFARMSEAKLMPMGDMAQAMGFPSAGMLDPFPVAVSWKVAEDYDAQSRVSLVLDSALMRAAARILEHPASD